MSDTLTPRDFDMLDDALFQMAGNEESAAREDRWLSLRSKVARMARAVMNRECACGHLRKSHRHATSVTSTCTVCQCQRFEETPDDH